MKVGLPVDQRTQETNQLPLAYQ